MGTIVDVRDVVVPIRSDIRNAYIDFSGMAVSVVAVLTDVVYDRRRVVGFGFNSYPDLFAPFNGFADHIPVEDSLVELPDRPGLAMETKTELYRSCPSRLPSPSRRSRQGACRCDRRERVG